MAAADSLPWVMASSVLGIERSLPDVRRPIPTRSRAVSAMPCAGPRRLAPRRRSPSGSLGARRALGGGRPLGGSAPPGGRACLARQGAGGGGAPAFALERSRDRARPRRLRSPGPSRLAGAIGAGRALARLLLPARRRL